MNTLTTLTFLLLAGVALVALLQPFLGIFFDLRFYYRYRLRERWKFFVPLKAEYLPPLEKFFPYYSQLSSIDQARFRHRMALFIRAKKFIARGELTEVTAEMVSLISATAVMLTLGLPLITFPSFRRILIYPTDYYSNINRTYHKGELNVRHGAIILSWDNFVQGMATADDGISLGIHELAHALHLEDRMVNREYNYLPNGLLAYWTLHAREEIEWIRSGNDHLFRPYAATNEEEFFAIALENFFERPREFQEDLPQLYNLLTRLLRQDPANGKILT